MSTAIAPTTNVKSAVEAAQKALKEAQAAYVATLPICPTDKLARLVELQSKLNLTAREADEIKEIKDAYRFREEEKQQLAAAKADRVKEASKEENRSIMAHAVMTGFIMDARRKLRADGRVVSTVKVLS